jgi:hypothetical protein
MKIELLEKPDVNWDKRLLENNGSFYQTTGYSEYLESSLGMKTIYLIATEPKNKNIIGQLSVNYYPLFAKYLIEKYKPLYNIFSKFFRTYSFIRGPTIFNKEKTYEITKGFIEYLDKEVKKNGFMLQDISLPLGVDTKVYKIFDSLGFYQDSWGTVIIDLKKREEEIMKDISKSQRKKIKKAQELNLIVKEAKTKEDYEKVIEIIENMESRNKIFEGSKNYYRTLLKILNEKKMIKTFYIESNGNLISTISLYLFGKNSLRALSAHTDYSVQEKIPGMMFIEWEAIKWARNNGYSTYDLTGIRPESTNSKDIGIKEYKTRWGGQIITYPYFSKVYSGFKGKIANFMRKMYKKKQKVQ